MKNKYVNTITFKDERIFLDDIELKQIRSAKLDFNDYEQNHASAPATLHLTIDVNIPGLRSRIVDNL
ncbi:hypothetical protein [Ligilactobacillus equi]|uniref:hypothetical protein n=1 Tax=Ligilactobacillus equi TaxID=137357 RepID=UPI00046AD087|nr:hypothetical protein [Ligilactobacillus equi]